MKLSHFVLRKSIVALKEPKWFHDFYSWEDQRGGFQIAFFSWLFWCDKTGEMILESFVYIIGLVILLILMKLFGV